LVKAGKKVCVRPGKTRTDAVSQKPEHFPGLLLFAPRECGDLWSPRSLGARKKLPRTKEEWEISNRSLRRWRFRAGVARVLVSLHHQPRPMT